MIYYYDDNNNMRGFAIDDVKPRKVKKEERENIKVLNMKEGEKAVYDSARENENPIEETENKRLKDRINQRRKGIEKKIDLLKYKVAMKLSPRFNISYFDDNIREILLAKDREYISNNRNSHLYYEYTKFINDSLTYNKKRKNINILYELDGLDDTDLSFTQKALIKRIARNASRNDIAEYIKPRSKIKEFFKRMTQKRLKEGETEREISTEEIIKDLGNEPGFNINEFIKQQEEKIGRPISLEEQKDIVKQYMATQEVKPKEPETLRDRVKYDVSGKGSNHTRTITEENERTDSSSGREIDD